MKIIIVGGVAGGASCAARLRRLDEHAQILMVERGPYVSYANCGLPYHVGDVIEQESALLVADADTFRTQFAIEVRTGCECVEVSPATRTVRLRDVASGEVTTALATRGTDSPMLDPSEPHRDHAPTRPCEETAMNAGTLIAAGLTVAAVALAAQAQQPTAGAARPGSTARPATANAPAQPALSALVAPRASELADAGVQKITARTGKDIRDIQVLTQYGPAYFAWPKNVTPVLFEIAVGTGNAITVTANDYSEANKARYVAAFDAVIPRALAQASNLKTRALRPRP
jgi:hypothetical protein